jgi:coenzyme F420 hydrogenase subunit beta
MYGLLHAGHDVEAGYRNRTVFSRSRAEVLAATGSRYAPASPCDGLEVIEKAPAACVFIGKPCDVEGVRNAQAIRARLSERIGVTIGIFCAGTPSTQGTLDLLSKHGIEPSTVEEARYRGRGWPGKFSVRLKGSGTWRDLATYADAWGFLEAYRPFRCHLCPDSTSEFADIACGDPWYRPIEENEEGLSLVLVRTEIGRRIVRGARESGYVSLQPVRPEVVDASQEELRQKRGAIWGRLVTMNALGVPAPKFRGFSLFHNWRRLSVRDKIRSFAGTVRRVIRRRYHMPDDYLAYSTPVPGPRHKSREL